MIIGLPAIYPFQSDGVHFDRWMTVSSFRVVLQYGNTVLQATIPEGFSTDLASVPWFAQRLFGLNPYEPEIVLPALVHDWLTPTDEERADPNNQFGQRPIYPQTIAAGVFYELMKEQRVPLVKRRVYYTAVVLAIKGKYW